MWRRSSSTSCSCLLLSVLSVTVGDCLLPCVAQVFVNLVLLNALIAIMGDTYDRVSETKLQRALLGRAQYILEVENRLSGSLNHRALRSKRLFPKWLHAVQRAEKSTSRRGRLEKGDWSGRVSAIRDEVARHSRRIEEKVREPQPEPVEPAPQAVQPEITLADVLRHTRMMQEARRNQTREKYKSWVV